jgi:3-hydroxymyristoyl/3-hydroxydecanoyl-(acyl carrier protein) dehydratases
MRFILIDEILEVNPGKHIRAIKHVAPDEDYFRDHFPGFPVVPGVLLTEMMAQTAGKCLEMEDAARGRSMLGRINSANFRTWVRPGELATIVAEIRTSRPRFAIAHCYVEVNGQEVASADLLFTFIPATQFAHDFRDEVVERYLAARTLQRGPNPASMLGTQPS